MQQIRNKQFGKYCLYKSTARLVHNENNDLKNISLKIERLA